MCVSRAAIDNLFHTDMEGFRYTSNNGVVRVDDEPNKDMVYLSANERVLEILHTGYKPKRIILHEIGIRLKGQQVWQIQITGDRDEDPIPVTILTEPQGAMIRIDGGEATEDIQHLLVPGTHRIAAAQSGYVSKDTVVHVDRNHALVRLTLEERSQYGAVDITVTPADASIVLVHESGQTFRAEGSHAFTQLPTGTFEYQITRSGYEPKSGQITVKAGQRLRGDIEIKERQPTARESYPQWEEPRLQTKKSGWVWWLLGLAAVGGGYYYYSTQLQQDESPTMMQFHISDEVAD
ncbi:MAG: carboxypeptidase-like regulatory domain-containing protein [candidate division KSB1 bacterium]|nr:carboxypeptidase-like regulatory domain-containing protein [candidate division KSB1 bacterium]